MSRAGWLPNIWRLHAEWPGAAAILTVGRFQLAQDLPVNLENEWRRSRPFGYFEGGPNAVDTIDGHADFFAEEEERKQNQVGSREDVAAPACIAHNVDDEAVGISVGVRDFVSSSVMAVVGFGWASWGSKGDRMPP